MYWKNAQGVKSKSYICGYCGTPLASERGWYGMEKNQRGSEYRKADIRICHQCDQPTYFLGDEQYPGSPFGEEVSDISDEGVDALYREARECTAAGAHTSAVLSCRKLLMHIAVSQGAEEGKRFIDYVNYLADEGYLPPGSKPWVDHIRKKGNEANHEIKIMSRDDAEELISFSELILKFLFEYPARMARKAPGNQNAA